MAISFSGFKAGKVHLTPIPAQFFSELLPAIDHLGELKVTLYAIWKLDQMENDLRYLRRDDFAEDERLMAGLASEPALAPACLDEALERAARRGTLLLAEIDAQGGGLPERYYFLNSARGRAALKAVQEGKVRLSPQGVPAPNLGQEALNVFRLYEENIGPLTPMIADLLREAEQAYPAVWIEEAIKIAVQRNARNWRFVETVLRRWKEKGRDEQDRRDTEKDGSWYLEDPYAKYTEH
jgi:DnaD/phage-associated family protein